MPRKIITPATNEVYHVFNRGVDKRDVFLDKMDYLRFYQTLHFFNSVEPVINYSQSTHNHSDKKLVEIIAYSLLPNHFHLLVKQLVDGGLSEFMKRVGGGYTSYFNTKNERSGALFQGVFKRVHVNTNAQFIYLLAYVNENHFVHNISFKREIYHSSSLHYQNIKASKLINAVPSSYSFKENVALANEVYKRRKNDKETRMKIIE